MSAYGCYKQFLCLCVDVGEYAYVKEKETRSPIKSAVCIMAARATDSDKA